MFSARSVTGSILRFLLGFAVLLVLALGLAALATEASGETAVHDTAAPAR